MVTQLRSYEKQIGSKIAGRHVLLFLDYDGTLVKFKKRPEFAVPTRRVIRLLEKLKGNNSVSVTIITGRPLDQIRDMAGVPGINYSASHGQQMRMADGDTFEWEKARKAGPLIKRIKSAAEKELHGISGILIEDKKTSLAVHYRKVGRKDVPGIKSSVTKLFKKLNSGGILGMIEGSDVMEIRPRGWDKGKAVKMIMKRYRPSAVIYIGDDTTDEDAFRALRSNVHAITIWVRNGSKRQTYACYSLKDPEEVLGFLDWLSSFCAANT